MCKTSDTVLQFAKLNYHMIMLHVCAWVPGLGYID